MTWDEIYKAAEGATCGDASLRTKDEARGQVRSLVLELGGRDLDDDEIPEETVEDHCNAMDIRFDKNGNIVDLTLPIWVTNIVCRKQDNEYLKEDIMTEVHTLESRDGVTYEVTKEIMDRLIERYEHCEDCNVPYNVVIEYVVRGVLKGEW